MAIGQLRKIVSFYGRFLPSFSAIGYHARRLRWPAFAPDFSGQTWLVTGASGGIGRAAALEAARRGARVLAVARSAGKLRALQNEAPASIEPLVADLALVREVRALVSGLAARGERIHVLLNNVGVMLDDYTLTAEGREASFATNLLNHYLLTEELIARELLAPGGVVIGMSSGGMYNVPLMVEALRMPARVQRGARLRSAQAGAGRAHGLVAQSPPRARPVLLRHASGVVRHRGRQDLAAAVSPAVAARAAR